MTPVLPDMIKKVHATEVLISWILRIGVTVSVVLIVLGVVISFMHHPAYLNSSAPLGHLLSPNGTQAHSLQGVLSGVQDARGQAIAMVGLLLLIATPMVRVAVSILAFVHQRDWTFVAITAVVLLLLLLSFLLGRAGG